MYIVIERKRVKRDRDKETERMTREEWARQWSQNDPESSGHSSKQTHKLKIMHRRIKSDREHGNKVRPKGVKEEFLLSKWPQCHEDHVEKVNRLFLVGQKISMPACLPAFDTEQNRCKKNLEKDLFTEGRATVCYSNYIVAGCKIYFWLTHLEYGRKGRGCSYWHRISRRVVGWLLLSWWGKNQGSFLKVGEGG